MRISEEDIQAVIDANDIVDVISAYTTLKKSGNSYKGCCPLHNEKTPSLSVSQDKQLYHCFGCGAGGNVIGFMMSIENISYVEAIEMLAQRAGVFLHKSEKTSDGAYEQKKRLLEIHRLSANLFYKNLVRHREALSYLIDRGLSEQSIKKFALGYALPEWQGLHDYLRKKGFSDEECLKSGLVIVNDHQRIYDRFRGRIMIPILNTQGQVVGFGGRKYLADDQGPKYLNSPETPLFSKGKLLFNLKNARKNAVDSGLIIVEGYMDVIALDGFGINNAIAALGTAFTPDHAAIISRYTSELTLCFDGDAAGEKATMKALDVLEASPLTLRVVRLPGDEDPDSFIRKYGTDAFKNMLASAQTAIEYRLQSVEKQCHLETVDGKIKYKKSVFEILKKIEDPAVLELYAAKVADTLNVSREAIVKTCLSAPPAVAQGGVEGKKPTKVDRSDLAQRHILKIILLENRFELLGYLDEALFTNRFYRKLFGLIQDKKTSPEHLISTIAGALETLREQRWFSAMMSEETDPNPELLKESFETLRTQSDLNLQKELKDRIGVLDGIDDQAEELLQTLIEAKRKRDT